MREMRSQMLQVLPPFRGEEDIIKNDQTTGDIIREVLQAHEVFAADYDKIAALWMDGNLNKVPKRLFKFCEKDLKYVEEPGDDQTTRSPAGILVMRGVDCKHYSGFIGGVLDAINRTGEYYYDWYYRFASEDILSPSAHHVFIVIKGEDGAEVWVDPVPAVGGYDERPIYFYKYDKRPKMALKRLSGTGGTGFRSVVTVSRESLYNKPAAVSGMRKIVPAGPLSGYSPGGARIGANQDAEKTLQDALKAYENGLVSSVSNLTNKNQVDGNIDSILKAAAASAVPGADKAMALAGSLAVAAGSIFGQGSVLARVANAAAGSNVLTAPLNIIKTALGGRSYYLDKYYMVNDFTYHVLGYSSGSSDGVKDSDVPVAGQWFITKTGVFVSSRTILGALRQGVDEYMNLHSGNPWITQDRVRVQLAHNVVVNYMPDVLTPKNWANTVGVYDNQVTAAISKARIQDPFAQVDTTGTNTTGLDSPVSTVMNYIQANPIPSILIGAGIAYGAYQLFKD